VNERTKRRAILSGIVTVGVGGISYALSQQGSDADEGEQYRRWLQASDNVPTSDVFAFVGGIATAREEPMDVHVALRETADESRTVELFASEDPVTIEIPPRRSVRRSAVDVTDRDPGEYTVRAEETTIPIQLVDDLPEDYAPDSSLTIFSRGAWRSDYIAHVRGYRRVEGGIGLDVAFRNRTGTGANPVDTLLVSDGDGNAVTMTDVAPDTHNTTILLESGESLTDESAVVARADGQPVTRVELFVFGED